MANDIERNAPGVIRTDEILTVEEFKARTGLGDFAFAKARRDGLKVSAVGKKLFVRGVNFDAYLAALDARESCGPIRKQA